MEAEAEAARVKAQEEADAQTEAKVQAEAEEEAKAQQEFHVGQRVEYDSISYGTWQPAVVQRIHSDGSVTLDIRDRADPSRIRPVDYTWEPEPEPQPAAVFADWLTSMGTGANKYVTAHRELTPTTDDLDSEVPKHIKVLPMRPGEVVQVEDSEEYFDQNHGGEKWMSVRNIFGEVGMVPESFVKDTEEHDICEEIKTQCEGDSDKTKCVEKFSESAEWLECHSAADKKNIHSRRAALMEGPGDKPVLLEQPEQGLQADEKERVEESVVGARSRDERKAEDEAKHRLQQSAMADERKRKDTEKKQKILFRDPFKGGNIQDSFIQAKETLHGINKTPKLSSMISTIDNINKSKQMVKNWLDT